MPAASSSPAVRRAPGSGRGRDPRMAARPHGRARDRRARRSVATIFFINGVVLASWVPHIPAVKQRLGIGDGALGLVLLAMAVGAVAALSMAGRLVRRFGSRVMTSVAALALCLALPLPLLSPSVARVALSLLVLGACNGMLDVSMNAQAVAVERRYRRPIMSSFHGLFSVGGLFGAACAGVVTWLGASPLQHVAGATLVALALVAAALPGLLLDAIERGAAGPAFARPTGRLRTLGLLAFAALLAEGAMADWSAVYLRDVLASSAALAAAGFAACSMMMAVGRFGGDRVVGAFGAAPVLRASGSLAAAGLALALLLGTPIAAIIGCGMVGLGIANAIPILFSRAGNLPGVDPGPALAAVATTGYLGFLAGPPLIGVVAELSTLRLGLGVVAVCCGLIAVGGGAAGTNAAPAQIVSGNGRAASESRP
jgi:fucose permease